MVYSLLSSRQRHINTLDPQRNIFAAIQSFPIFSCIHRSERPTTTPVRELRRGADARASRSRHRRSRSGAARRGGRARAPARGAAVARGRTYGGVAVRALDLLARVRVVDVGALGDGAVVDAAELRDEDVRVSAEARAAVLDGDDGAGEGGG